MPNNIPTNALLLLPIAWLSPLPAKIVLTIFSLIAFAFSLSILFSLYNISYKENFGLIVLATIFLFRPIYDNIALGQIYFFLLLLFCLSAKGILQQKKFFSSFPISFTLLLKGYGAIPMLWLFIKKEWKIISVIILTILAVTILTFPLFGLYSWLTFFHKALPTISYSPFITNVAYQNINGFAANLFFYAKLWFPFLGGALSKNVVSMLSFTFNILFVIIILKNVSRIPNDKKILSYSAAIAVGVLTAPIAEEYHYVLFLPLVIGLSTELFRGEKETHFGFLEILFIISLLTMGIPPQYYKSLNLSAFPIILFAYPKLYAGVCFLFLYKKLTTQKHNPPNLFLSKLAHNLIFS